MFILPDTSVLIPYIMQRAYRERIDRAVRLHRLALCSVVVEEIMAGARDQSERRDYEALFGVFRRSGIVATPNDEAWRRCGALLSRYRERYGAIETRDHQNDVLIVLTALQLTQEQQVTIVTENDADFTTWLGFIRNRSGLLIEAVRRS